jgi:nitrate reductase assembly molybdenum cofactor insertion protein NarJ
MKKLRPGACETKMSYAHYGDMAALVDFPGPDLTARGRSLLQRLGDCCPEAAREVEQFLAAIPAGTLDRQELHTRTFDVQSLTTLDVGYVLFGDDYKRGALLSNLNQEHERACNDCGRELADYLPNLLRLIPKLDDREVRDELVEQILLPAVMLMIREFDPERIDRKNANYRKHYKTLIDPARAGDPTVYRRALEAVLRVLERDFRLSGTIARLSAAGSRPQTVEFLRLVEREMDIERDANPANSGCDA